MKSGVNFWIPLCVRGPCRVVGDALFPTDCSSYMGYITNTLVAQSLETTLYWKWVWPARYPGNSRRISIYKCVFSTVVHWLQLAGRCPPSHSLSHSSPAGQRRKVYKIKIKKAWVKIKVVWLKKKKTAYGRKGECILYLCQQMMSSCFLGNRASERCFARQMP